MPTHLTTLHLYRQVLKACKRFPTKNRNELYEEIREEFRRGATIGDSAEIEKRRGVAIDGLEKMRSYSGDDGWNVKLKGPDQRPLG